MKEEIPRPESHSGKRQWALHHRAGPQATLFTLTPSTQGLGSQGQSSAPGCGLFPLEQCGELLLQVSATQRHPPRAPGGLLCRQTLPSQVRAEEPRGLGGSLWASHEEVLLRGLLRWALSTR